MTLRERYLKAKESEAIETVIIGVGLGVPVVSVALLAIFLPSFL